MIPILIGFSAALLYNYGYITSRISTTSSVDIVKSFFCNFSITSGYGSAIYQSASATLQLTYCVFQSCTASSYGGCIFVSNSGSNISNCCFTLCYITVKADNLYGSCMYLSSSYIAVYGCSALLCGPTVTADSTYFCCSMDTQCLFQNFTGCNGYGGSSGINLYRSTAFTSTSVSIEFCLVSSCQNACAFVHELAVDSSSNSYLEVINGTFTNYMYYLSSGATPTISNSAVFGSTFTGVCGPGAISFVNCVGDFSLSGFTLTSGTVTVGIGSLPIGHCYESIQFSPAFAFGRSKLMTALDIFVFQTSFE